MTTQARMVRSRAYHRALAQLAAAHPVEFRALYEQCKAAAWGEVPTLPVTVPGELPRLRPGARLPGEASADRVDVKWCPLCRTYHDNDHTVPAPEAVTLTDALSLPFTTLQARSESQVINDQVTELYAAGMSCALIAQEVGLSLYEVRRLIDAGVER